VGVELEAKHRGEEGTGAADQVTTRGFRVFAALSTGAVVPLLSVAAWQQESTNSGDAASLLVWLGLVVVADLFLVPLWGDVKFSMTLPVLLAAGFVLNPALAGILAFAGFVDPREWRGDFRLARSAANRSQIAAAVVCATSLFHFMGGDLGDWPAVLIPAAAAICVDCAVNLSLVVLGKALLARESVGLVWRSLGAGCGARFALSYACCGIMALLLSMAYLQAGAWGLVVCLAPLFLASQMLSRGTSLLEAAKAIERKDKMFLLLSEQVASEREDERKQIASSLHDDVLQSLHYLTLHAQVIREDLRHGRLLQLEEDIPLLLATSQRTADLARSVVKDLRTSPLGRDGVASTLESLISKFADEFAGRIEYGIERIQGVGVRQTLIYQVAREAITNAVRHGEASLIEVTLRQEPEGVRATVVDDGRGFDTGTGDRHGHFGLALMRERIGAADGRLSVVSSPGQGTRVDAWFPDPPK